MGASMILQAGYSEVYSICLYLESIYKDLGQYSSVEVDTDTLYDSVLAWCTSEDSAVFLLIEDKKIVGIFIGVLNQIWYSREYEAVEILLYIDEKHRSLKAFSYLMETFDAWWEEEDALYAVLGATSSEKDLTKLYSVVGYSPAGRYYRRYNGKSCQTDKEGGQSGEERCQGST